MAAKLGDCLPLAYGEPAPGTEVDADAEAPPARPKRPPAAYGEV